MSAKKWFQFVAVTTSLMMFAIGCPKNSNNVNDPKQRLIDYISQSFAIKEAADRSKLIAFLTGGAKNRLLAWSDEQFKEAFVDSKRQFIKLSIREIKSTTDQQTNITYELTYTDQKKGVDARVTHKRMCELVLEDGKWYIREVHNIKELIEYKNEMSLQVGKF